MFDILKSTAEYKKLKSHLAVTGAAALFGMPPVAHARLLRELAEENGQSLLVVTPGEAEATRLAPDLATLGLPAAVFPPRDFLLRPIEGAGGNTNTGALQCWAIWWVTVSGRCACPPRPCCNTPYPRPSSVPIP